MASETKNSRTRILEAAGELAREVGPGNISLDAVAQRAGLSKGGLLYNFPSKAKLMQGLVELHVSKSREAIASACERDGTEANALARAVVEVFREECGAKPKGSAGVLAAVAENPDFLNPVRRHLEDIVHRLKTESKDPEIACLVFLMVEGMRCMQLFEIDVFGPEEQEKLLSRMVSLTRDGSADPA